jgi:hypothetical protein
MPRSNVVNYEKVVKQIRKENNLLLLRRCRYYMLQLAKEMATATQRELTPNESNNVLSYEEYLSDVKYLSVIQIALQVLTNDITSTIIMSFKMHYILSFFI